jgi:hypothetical protein
MLLYFLHYTLNQRKLSKTTTESLYILFTKQTIKTY